MACTYCDADVDGGCTSAAGSSSCLREQLQAAQARIVALEEGMAPFAAILKDGEPVGPIPRGLLDRRLTRADLKRASALMRAPGEKPPQWAPIR